MKRISVVFAGLVMCGFLLPDASFANRHTSKVQAVRSGDYDLALIGDSITQVIGEFGGKYRPLRATWDKYYASRKAINLGYSGYRTDQILRNLQGGELDFKKPPKVVMLLIGTNNANDRYLKNGADKKVDEIFDGTKAIVELIRKKLPTTKILLLRIFPRGGKNQKGVSPPIFHASQRCIDICFEAGQRTASLADGKHVFWLDINYTFLRPDGLINTDILWDLLHPSPAGADAMAQAIEPTLARLMGDKPKVDPAPVSVKPVPRRDGQYNWQQRHQAVIDAHDTDPAIVFLGDSITHHMGGEPEATGAFKNDRGHEFWETVCNAAGGGGLNLGFGADWTQHLLWRIDHGELDGIDPHYVVLMIGANNVLGHENADEIVAGIRACVLRIRAKVPHAKLIMMGVLPCRNPATKPERAIVNDVNKALKELAAEAKCSFLDIGDKFLDANGNIPKSLMRDTVHPTKAGYKIWSDALLPLL